MKCLRCNKESGNVHVCDTCVAESAARVQQHEEASRAVACPDCAAGIGELCLTGSGGRRNYVHATRHKLAAKVAKAGAA